MKINKLFAAVSLGLFAQCAAAAPAGYEYIGSFTVADGPSWGSNPQVYSAVEAAAFVFGGLASDYDVSIFSPYYDPLLNNQPLFDTLGKPIPGVISPNAIISNTGWYDYYGMQPYWPMVNGAVTYSLLPRPGTGTVYMTPNGLHPYSIYVQAETFKLDAGAPGYRIPDVFTPVSLTNGAVSAYVNDHFGKNQYTKAYFTNYVWKYTAPPIPPVPEPETYAMMLAGLGLVISIAHRRMSA